MKLQRPAPALVPFISHYWLSHPNTHTEHLILPDGCVDVVYGIGGVTFGDVHGVATRRSRCSMSPGLHYLGIGIRPGQARHFLTLAQNHLADSSRPIDHLAALKPESLADDIASGEVFERLDAALLSWLAARPVVASAVDTALGVMDRRRGCVRVEVVASQVGISRRQLERSFLNDVGMPPKTYARIRRWRYALGLLRAADGMPLADVAQRAGYADQSHMNRDFRRFAGRPPGLLTADAFVQDHVSPPY